MFCTLIRVEKDLVMGGISEGLRNFDTDTFCLFGH